MAPVVMNSGVLRHGMALGRSRRPRLFELASGIADPVLPLVMRRDEPVLAAIPPEGAKHLDTAL